MDTKFVLITLTTILGFIPHGVNSQCESPDNQLDLNILTHEFADNLPKDLDFIVLMDRSRSVADSSDIAKDIIRRYVAFITLDCSADFESGTDHLALIPFGMLPETTTDGTFDGITNPGLSNACDFVSYLDTIPVAASNVGPESTSVITALVTADTLFSNAR